MVVEMVEMMVGLVVKVAVLERQVSIMNLKPLKLGWILIITACNFSHYDEASHLTSIPKSSSDEF